MKSKLPNGYSRDLPDLQVYLIGALRAAAHTCRVHPDWQWVKGQRSGLALALREVTRSLRTYGQ